MNLTKIKIKMLNNRNRIIELLELLPEGPNENIISSTLEIEKYLLHFYRDHNILIPSQLKEWFNIKNGTFVNSQILFSIEEISNVYLYQSEWKINGWIPVGMDGTGNSYIMPTKKDFGDGNPVLFFDPFEEYGKPRYIVASDMSHFLEFLLEDELNLNTSWPFEKQYVLQKDPNIVNFFNTQLPWHLI